MYLSRQNLFKQAGKQAKQRWAAGESPAPPTARVSPLPESFFRV